MPTLGEVGRRLLYLFRRDERSAELEEEMHLHIEHRAAQLQSTGLNHADAAFAARRRFGNTIQMEERSRDAWGFLAIEHLAADFRYALRQRRQSPGFTFAAVLCLALGVWLACVVSAVGRGVYRPEL